MSELSGEAVASSSAPVSKRDNTELSEEEQRRILESPPKGTWAIILIIGLGLLLGWLYFFFGIFMSHGPVA